MIYSKLVIPSIEVQAPSYFGSVVADCKAFFPPFNSCIISHVRREANMLAHKLAKFALEIGDNIWIEETPPCIASLAASEF